MLLQAYDLPVRCRFTTRHLWKAHTLLEGVRNFLLLLPRRKALWRIGGGVGVPYSERAIELVRNVQIGVRSEFGRS